jgi:UTP:GlnB (protein PII) uridylyltransferase
MHPCRSRADLVINKAYISSDGCWFVDVFWVNETTGGKVNNPSKLSAIEQTLQHCISLLRVHHFGRRSSLDSSGASSAPTPELGVARYRRSFEGVQTSYTPRTSLDDASVTDLPTGADNTCTSSSTMIIEMVGKDEPGRLARISKLLAEQGLTIADMVSPPLCLLLTRETPAARSNHDPSFVSTAHT